MSRAPTDLSMQVYWIAALVFGIVIALFAVQNSAPVPIRFLWIGVEDVPISVLVLICATLGALVTFCSGWAARSDCGCRGVDAAHGPFARPADRRAGGDRPAARAGQGRAAGQARRAAGGWGRIGAGGRSKPPATSGRPGAAGRRRPELPEGGRLG